MVIITYNSTVHSHAQKLTLSGLAVRDQVMVWISTNRITDQGRIKLELQLLHAATDDDPVDIALPGHGELVSVVRGFALDIASFEVILGKGTHIPDLLADAVQQLLNEHATITIARDAVAGDIKIGLTHEEHTFEAPIPQDIAERFFTW